MKTRAVMTGIARKHEQTGLRPIDQIQRNYDKAVNALNANPLTPQAGSGAHVQGQVIASGATLVVKHGLGRKPVGWLVTRALNNWAVLLETASDDNTITLRQSGLYGTTTVDLWVF